MHHSSDSRVSKDAERPVREHVPGSPKASRVASIDALRAVAALGVATFHLYSQYSLAEWREALPAFVHWFAMAGRWGVQLFFVISGFVIALTLFDRPNFDRPVDVGYYFARRLVRLDLVYLLALSLYILASVGRSDCSGLSVLQDPDMVPCPQWTTDQLAKNIFYFVPIEGQFWIPVAWTLAIEVHFYLLAAAFFVCLNRLGIQSHAPALICLLALASLAFPAGLFGRTDADWIAPCLFNLLGGCLAFMVIFRRSPIVVWSCVFYIVGLSGVFAIQRETHVIATLGSWGLVILTVSFFSRVSAVPGLLALGRYSYGIYLFHLLVGFYVVQPIALSGLPIISWGPVPLVLGLLFTVALSAASYRLVESPSIRWSKRIGR
jgi:peptidoglycan/LPS O-acetylase OafA/YrhL